MNMSALIKILQTKKVHLLTAEQLDELLQNCDILFEKDTLISGFIRIMGYKNFYITQEISNKKEVVLRLYNSRSEAEELVADRLATYDNMWDGCGCKVDYYS